MIISSRSEKSVNPANSGTKAAVHFKRMISPGKSEVFRLRLSEAGMKKPFEDFDNDFQRRIRKPIFLCGNTNKHAERGTENHPRQAFAGMIWCKQFYYYNVKKWLKGDPAGPTATGRTEKRKKSSMAASE